MRRPIVIRKGRFSLNGKICAICFSVLIIAALLFSGAWPSQCQADSVRRVLVLNSYHPEYVWENSMVEGIRSVFDDSATDVVLCYEYMDTKHYSPEVVFEPLRRLYSVKYSDVKFDVIIASDDNALNFLLLYRDELFPESPVVFCGINGFTKELIRGHDGVYGLLQKTLISREPLTLPLANHPGTRNFAVVSGTSTSSRINQRKMRELRTLFEDRVAFIDLTLLNPPELKRRLTRLPRDTVIIYLSYYKMPDGTFLTVPESTSFVFNHSKMPIYSPWEYTLGNAVVGRHDAEWKKGGAESSSLCIAAV